MTEFDILLIVLVLVFGVALGVVFVLESQAIHEQREQAKKERGY